MARRYTKTVDLVYVNICKRVQIRALLQYSEQTLLDSLYMSHQVKHSDESQQTFRYRMAGLCRFSSLPTQMRRQYDGDGLYYAKFRRRGSGLPPKAGPGTV